VEQGDYLRDKTEESGSLRATIKPYDRPQSHREQSGIPPKKCDPLIALLERDERLQTDGQQRKGRGTYLEENGPPNAVMEQGDKLLIRREQSYQSDQLINLLEKDTMLQTHRQQKKGLGIYPEGSNPYNTQIEESDKVLTHRVQSYLSDPLINLLENDKRLQTQDHKKGPGTHPEESKSHSDLLERRDKLQTHYQSDPLLNLLENDKRLQTHREHEKGLDILTEESEPIGAVMEQRDLLANFLEQYKRLQTHRGHKRDLVIPPEQGNPNSSLIEQSGKLQAHSLVNHPQQNDPLLTFEKDDRLHIHGEHRNGQGINSEVSECLGNKMEQSNKLQTNRERTTSFSALMERCEGLKAKMDQDLVFMARGDKKYNLGGHPEQSNPNISFIEQSGKLQGHRECSDSNHPEQNDPLLTFLETDERLQIKREHRNGQGINSEEIESLGTEMEQSDKLQTNRERSTSFSALMERCESLKAKMDQDLMFTTLGDKKYNLSTHSEQSNPNSSLMEQSGKLQAPREHKDSLGNHLEQNDPLLTFLETDQRLQIKREHRIDQGIHLEESDHKGNEIEDSHTFQIKRERSGSFSAFMEQCESLKAKMDQDLMLQTTDDKKYTLGTHPEQRDNHGTVTERSLCLKNIHGGNLNLGPSPSARLRPGPKPRNGGRSDPAKSEDSESFLYQWDFKCGVCFKTFTRKRSLARHYRNPCYKTFYSSK
jgi:hypothetical protein